MPRLAAFRTREPSRSRLTMEERARAYLLGHRCMDGGFCFYRSDVLEESNPFDTWHALEALALLKEPLAAPDRTARFLVEQPVQGQPYALYYRVRALRCLGAADPQEPRVREAVAALQVRLPRSGQDPLAGPLERLSLALWLKQAFGLDFPAEEIVATLRTLEHPDGGFGHPPNLADTCQALAVLDACAGTPRPRTADFVRALAWPGYGFRLARSSFAPSLETTCAGIQCCRRLALDIPHGADARIFIATCQTGDGGFAAAPDALPNIGLTHLALAGLDALANPLST